MEEYRSKSRSFRPKYKFGFLAAFYAITALASLFVAAQALGAGAGSAATWIDISHLSFVSADGRQHVYFDNRLDSDHTFKETDPIGNCPDRIDSVDINGHTAHYVPVFQTNEAGCVDQPVQNITLIGFPSTSFNWQDSTHIKSADEQHTFAVVDAKKPNDYYKQDDDTHCIDSITVDPNDPAHGTLIVRDTGTDNLGFGVHSPLNSDKDRYLREKYDGWPFADQISYKQNIGDCIESGGVRVTIGNVANYKKKGEIDALGAGQSAPSCKVGVLSWIICPFIAIVNSIIRTLEEWVKNLLVVSPLSPEVKTVEQNFTKIADVFFVLIFLVIIFSTTLSLGVDNYTIKKVLPRLIIAALLIQFSYYIIQFLVDASNIVGQGVAGMFNVVSGSGSFNDGVTASVGVIGLLAVGVVSFAIAPEILGAVLLILLGLLISIFAVFATLFIRLILIQLLALVAPLAFVAWVLPGTESYFKWWWKNLTKLLMMYPIIVAIISVANMVSKTSNSILTSSNQTLTGLVTSIAPIIGFAMIPMTFKMSGGLMAAVGGAVMSRASSARGRVANGSARQALKSSRQERGAIRSQEGTTKFGRFSGRAISGNIMPGTASNRRLAAQYATAAKARRGDAIEQIKGANDGKGLGFDDLKNLADGGAAAAKVGREHGIAVNAQSQAAAIETLAQKQQWGDIRTLKQQHEKAGDKGYERILNQGLEGNSDVFQKAPDIKLGDSAFQAPNADKISNWDPSTARAALDYYGTAEGSKYQQVAANAVQSLADTPAARSRTDIRTVGTLAQAARTPGSFLAATGASALKVNSGGKDIAVGEFMQSRTQAPQEIEKRSDDGKITRTITSTFISESDKGGSGGTSGGSSRSGGPGGGGEGGGSFGIGPLPTPSGTGPSSPVSARPVGGTASATAAPPAPPTNIPAGGPGAAGAGFASDHGSNPYPSGTPASADPLSGYVGQNPSATSSGGEQSYATPVSAAMPSSALHGKKPSTESYMHFNPDNNRWEPVSNAAYQNFKDLGHQVMKVRDGRTIG